jgi:hypothetical protein
MEYFVVERVPAERIAYYDRNGAMVSVWADEMPADVPPEAVQQRRESERRSVMWYKLNGVEVLDQQEWDGRYIPIIPVYGNEYDIDGKVIYSGLVRAAKDAQRLYNFMRSLLSHISFIDCFANFNRLH